MSIVPENVLHGLYRAYCEAKFPYTPSAYVSADARERHIDYDARSYYEPDHVGPLAELVEAAYAAGLKAAAGNAVTLHVGPTS